MFTLVGHALSRPKQPRERARALLLALDLLATFFDVSEDVVID